MVRVIEISVRNRIAWQTNRKEYVCGNSDFVVDFVFDKEWDNVETKTARFVHGGQHTDVVFTGNRCNVPVILNARRMTVGVYAGDLRVTTCATVECRKSILCEAGLPADPVPDVYTQMMEMIDSGMLKGDNGEKGDPGYTPVKGVDYFDGADGKDGEDMSPVVCKASGEVVTVQDASNRGLKGLTIYGKTTQQTYSGKNLFHRDYERTETTNGVTFYWDAESQEFVFNGTVTANGDLKLVNPFVIDWVVGETYTVSVRHTGGTATLVNAVEGGTNFGWSIFSTDLKKYMRGSVALTSFPATYSFSSKAVEASGGGYLFYFQCWKTGTVFDNYRVKVQIEQGNTVTDWEPYVGGIPSPNQNYPQELNSVGTDGAVDVFCNGANFARGYDDVTSTNKGVTTKRHKDHAYADISGTATGLISLALVGDYNLSKDGAKILYLPAGAYQFVIPKEYSRLVKYRKSSTGTTIYNMSVNNTFTLTEDTWLSNIWFDIVEGDVFPDGYRMYYGLYREGNVPAEWIDWQDGGSMSVSTPNGLHGIPVESGGNYTDANGQRWICDEVEFSRGVYVQRIGCIESYTGEDIPSVFISTTGELTDGAKVLYVLATSVETALTAEQLAAFAQMHSLYPSTVVTNKDGAYMAVDYVADTKTYIDNKFAELAAAIVNNT